MISRAEWSVLFPRLPAGAEIEPSALKKALDTAESTHVLSDARIAELRRTLDLDSSTGTAAKARTSSWLKVQVGLDDRAPFLPEVERIRVTTENGTAFGHQHAALSVIRELRELGYRGKLELIVPKGAEDKMVTLLAGIDRSDLEIVLEKDFDPKTAKKAIGVVAACDHDEKSFLDQLGVDACLVLQPYDWPGERRLEVRGKKTEQLGLPSSSTYVYTVDDPLLGVEPLLPVQMKAISDFIDRAMIGQPPLVAAKKDGLLAVFRAVISGKSDLMPIYGLHGRSIQPEIVLSNLKHGVRAFQERSGDGAKSAVLLAVGLDGIDGLRRPDLSTRLRTMGKQEVELVNAGALPRPIFELLYKYATLPSVLEGANTSNLVQLLGKPFLSVFASLTGLPQLPGVDPVLKVSDRLRVDEAEENIGRLQKTLNVLIGTRDEFPHELRGPVHSAILRGAELTDRESDEMKQNLKRAIAAKRRGLGEAQVEGLALLITSSMVGLCHTLAELTSLSTDVRRAIVEFDPFEKDAPEKSGAIIDACEEAVIEMVAGRIADLIEGTRDPNSIVSRYFEAVEERATRAENRQLVRGLTKLLEASSS